MPVRTVKREQLSEMVAAGAAVRGSAPRAVPASATHLQGLIIRAIDERMAEAIKTIDTAPFEARLAVLEKLLGDLRGRAEQERKAIVEQVAAQTSGREDIAQLRRAVEVEGSAQRALLSKLSLDSQPTAAHDEAGTPALLREVLASLESAPQPPRRWRFDIHHDDYGRIDSVTAVAQE